MTITLFVLSFIDRILFERSSGDHPKWFRAGEGWRELDDSLQSWTKAESMPSRDTWRDEYDPRT